MYRSITRFMNRQPGGRWLKEVAGSSATARRTKWPKPGDIVQKKGGSDAAPGRGLGRDYKVVRVTRQDRKTIWVTVISLKKDGTEEPEEVLLLDDLVLWTSKKRCKHKVGGNRP